jgi:hypothetical protein
MSFFNMKRFLPILVVIISGFFAPNVPARSAIRNIDFRNFTFPGIFEKRITLRGGKSTVETKNCETQYELDDVVYRDLNRDGREDALVSIWDFTACGSSCVSYDFYIYTTRDYRPSLLWKFSSGCQGVGGLKDFRMSGRSLVFELFGKTGIAGAKIQSAGYNDGGECCPNFYSVVRVAWDGRRFRQVGMKFFPYNEATADDKYLRKHRH